MIRGLIVKLGALTGLLILVGAVPASAADTPFPEEMLVQLGQPSVYCVHMSGSLAVTMPRKISANVEALQAAYENAQRQNELPANLSRAETYWVLISLDPLKFLNVSKDRESKTVSGLGAGGSAFAVSREGILLTNAHVVDLNASDLAQRPDLLATTFSDSLATITAQLGARLPDEAQAKAARVIFVALYSNHMMTAEPKDVKIELFTKVPTFPKMELRLSGPVLSKDLEHGIPARIVAKGKVYPGRDVAVLKTARSDDGALDKDKLICLRLGDSDDVRPGAHLQSFGFPGAAFRPEIMPDNARRLVSCQNGQLGQIKPLRGEMPVIFEITNDIHHGDSGGPIIDKHGHVIALNVAGYPLKPGDGDLTLPGHNVAIPINVVKPFLKAAGIEMLDPGPLTECWERGLRLYAAEDYAGAEKEFAELLRLETGKWLSALDRLTGSDGIDGSGNAYAHDLYVLCQKKQGKLKLPARN